MQGKMHGIWLTQSQGTLHPAIIPNLSSLVSDAASCHFEIVLWTNTNELASEEIDKLKQAKITIKDHAECRRSQLYPYFEFFLTKGINGDKTAFALASDILRMAILQLTPPNEYFLYFDPNDVVFIDLKKSLSLLEKNMSKNTWGFSFYVANVFGRKDFFQMRNDVLLAKKCINPDFFTAYLRAYQAQVKKMFQQYVKPVTNEQALQQANSISNQINENFFRTGSIDDSGTIYAFAMFDVFGKYMQVHSLAHWGNYLDCMRIKAHGNTWLPTDNNPEAQKRLEELAAYTGKEAYYDSSHIDILNERYQIKFKPFMRPDYYADALLDTDTNDLKRTFSINDDLLSRGINTRQTFFGGKNYLVVCDINTKDIGDKIYSLFSENELKS